MLSPQDWQPLEKVHRIYAARHNGPFRRGEHEWRFNTLEIPWQPISDIALWRNDAGIAEGYALYNQPHSGQDEGSVVVLEFVANSADAYKNLAAFFATHDIARKIILRGAADDALPLLFSETERLEVMSHYTVMLRVCDFERAMRLRPAARDDEVCEVKLRVEDTDAPWNAGVWQVGVAEGRSWAEPAQGDAELKIDARMLGPMYNGYLKPSTAASAGLLEVEDEDAVARADRVFAARQTPFFIDTF